MAERCPKCGEARVPERAACGKCGLANDRMPAYSEAHEATAGDDIRAAWDRAVADWASPSRHDELMQLVARHGIYAWAAGRYRDAAREQPDDPIARRQIERLQKAAEATMFASAATRPDRTPAPYRATVAVLGLMIVAIIVGFAYAILKHADSNPDTPEGQLTPATPVAPQTR